ncbi:MAG: hypothetical protein ABIB71_08610 [Candidatus Woesearchaeota archaeon]
MFLSLEERMKNLDQNEIRSRFQKALNRRDYSIPSFEWQLMPSDKDDLVSRINSYLGRGEEMWQKEHKRIYKRINTDLLKRVHYGMACLRGGSIPKEIISKLNPWEELCLFAGIWKKRDYVMGPLPDMVATFIKEGYDLLHKMHMVKKAFHQYKTTLKIPGSQHYRKESREKQKAVFEKKEARIRQGMANIICLLDQELTEPSEELGEEIAVLLDSCSKGELAFLRRNYGDKLLGDYVGEVS